MTAEALYLLGLGVILVLVRSPWPWTRGGAAALLVAALAWAGGAAWAGAAASFDGPRPPATLLAVLVAAVTWWSLAEARGRRPAAPSSVRAVALGLGVVAVGVLAATLGAPPAGEASPSWFLGGLRALAPVVGSTYALVVVPAVALVGLLSAPWLDAGASMSAPVPSDLGPSAPVPSDPVPAGPRPARPVTPADGRRDEVPFFFFAWLAVGVVPIVIAAWRPELGHAPSPSLADRFWLDWLARPAPAAVALRELPGLALYGLVFGLLPWRLPTFKATRGVFSRHRRRLGPARYGLTLALTGALVLVPVKVALHVLLGVGPWIVWGDLAL